MLEKFKLIFSKYWIFTFFLLIGSFLFYFQISLDELYSVFFLLEISQLLILIFIFFINSGLHIISRKVLLQALGNRCGWKNLLYIHFAALSAHYTTPVKIGFPLTVILLNRFENVPYQKSVTMIFVELVVGLGLCGFIALLNYSVISSGVENIGLSSAYILLIILILLVLVFFLYLKYSLVNIVQRSINALNSIKNVGPQIIAGYLLLAVLLRILDGTSLYFLSIYYGSQITLIEAISATSVSYFFGAISLIPMGLGSRDMSLLLFLHQYDISNEIAIAIVTLQRLLSTGLGFLLGIVFGGVLGLNAILSTENKMKL